MKRFHLHVRVDNLSKNIEFYTALFQKSPAMKKDDYAKWVLDEPALNFALSTHGNETGINHIGIEFSNDSEFDKLVSARLSQMTCDTARQPDANCCYAKSKKLWLQDPQGVPWEFFQSHGTLNEYGISDTKETILQAQKINADNQSVDGQDSCCQVRA